MTAGLLSLHDVWVGRARTTRYPGTNPPIATENMDIKNIMKREARRIGYKNWNTPLPEQIVDTTGIKEEIEALVPDDVDQWMVKTSWLLTYYEFWMNAYPDARWVFTYRPPVEIHDSINRHPSMARRSEKQKFMFIRDLQKRQREIAPKVAHHFAVSVKKVAQKNKQEINLLFKFLRIPVDWNIVSDFIEPNRMK